MPFYIFYFYQSIMQIYILFKTVCQCGTNFIHLNHTYRILISKFESEEIQTIIFFQTYTYTNFHFNFESILPIFVMTMKGKNIYMKDIFFQSIFGVDMIKFLFLNFSCLFLCLFGVFRPTREFFTYSEMSPLPMKGCKF